MNTTLDMERIAKELGAERRRKVSAHGGYFGALQLAAEVASRSRVSEGPSSPNEILKGDNLIYDDEARQKLLDKLDYELWLLNELTEYQIFDGGTDITTFKIRSGESRAEVILDSGEELVTSSQVIAAMTSLVFTASYKILDMIFEWILEENHRVGKIKEVPWRFTDKSDFLKDKSKLQYPPLFTSQKYLYSYSEALFHRLLPYRNEIVHNNAFSVCNDQLILSTSKNKNIGLTLSRSQIGCLVRFVVALARALAGVIEVDVHRDGLLRYHLDSLRTVHGLEALKQKKPLLVNVELEVPKRCGSFLGNLKQVRDKVRTLFPTQDVFFNLTVQAVDGDNLIAKWYFKEEDVPTLDEVNFDQGSYKAHRVD
ncbi:MAG: hypothetical protein OXI58_15745 [Gemmatimonadota bacterium]|nr:hypothetical protein [Gemmatimonadota bacterium]